MGPSNPGRDLNFARLSPVPLLVDYLSIRLGLGQVPVTPLAFAAPHFRLAKGVIAPPHGFSHPAVASMARIAEKIASWAGGPIPNQVPRDRSRRALHSDR